MAKKENPRISVNIWERIAKEEFEETVTEPWFGIDITINCSLGLQDVLGFVSEVADACFTSSGEFLPEIMDFAIRRGVLTRYANFTLPENVEKQYWLIYNTDAVGAVMRHVNRSQFREITDAINEKVKHMRNSDIMALRSKIMEVADVFTRMQEETAGLFKGLSQEDVQAFIGAVKDNAAVEEKIVDAYVDRMKRDARDMVALDEER